MVDDDYSPVTPRVSIALTPETDSADGNINEGQTIDITIAATPAPSSIDVVINVEQEADYIAFRVPRVHRLTTGSASIKIRTINDSVPDGSGNNHCIYC